MPQTRPLAGLAGRCEATTAPDDAEAGPSADAPERRLRLSPGPAPGGLERRAMRRRAKDGKKPPCPFCGSCTSSVYRSKGVISFDAYRRRRQCADCREDWPTAETLDAERFAKELTERGVTLEDLAAENPVGQRRAADGRRRRE